LCLFLTLSGCQNSNKTDSQAAEKKQIEQSQTQTPQFESITQELMLKVWNEVDLLDYIFHDLPFSMSQNEQPSIRSNVAYIGQEAQPFIPQGCKPIARQFYQTEGDIFLEADIYFGEHCKFYVFFIDGKAVYANKMSNEGILFFQTMITKALKASKSIG